MSEVLERRREGRILRLTLNRPEKRNALNIDLCRALVDAIEEDDHGVILLSAKGPVFCAGMDLTETLTSRAEEIHEIHQALFSWHRVCTKPIVCAVNGAALGGGAGLVANCCIAVAADTATFGLTEIRLGLWPILVYPAMIMAIGERRTNELAITGRIFGAEDARIYGLVHLVVPAADVETVALGIAQGIAEHSPTAMEKGLEYVHELRTTRSPAALGRRVRREIFKSADFKEGVEAFNEKRKPRWPSLELNGG